MLSAGVVAAQPAAPSTDLQPPAPLLMPELAARTRVVVSPLVSSGLLINMLQLGVAGTFAIHDLELFGDVRARVAGIVNYDGGGNESNGAFLGNLRAGARYHVQAGSLRVAPSAWAWLPSSNAPYDDQTLYAQMSGADNFRAFGPRATALGVGLDAGWYAGTRFAQLEVGTAIVSDHGPQVDNIFGAIGFGSQVSPHTSLLAEWRVDVFPMRETMHGPAIGFGRGDGQELSWRMRFHPYVLGNFEWAGLAIAFDIIRRF